MEEVHVTLHFGCHSKRVHLAVANLGQHMVIIGHSWLTLHNPEVDWVSRKVLMTRCSPHCDGHFLLKSNPPPLHYTPPTPSGRQKPGYATLLLLEWDQRTRASTPLL